MVLNDNNRAHMFKLKPSITPVGALVGGLTASLLCSALWPRSFKSSRLLISSKQPPAPLRVPAPLFMTPYNAQHRAHRQWVELKCHKKHIHVPNVSSRQKALEVDFLSAQLAKCCSLLLLSTPPGRRDASHNEWGKKMFFTQTKKCLEAAGSFPQSGITNAQTGDVSFSFPLVFL